MNTFQSKSIFIDSDPRIHRPDGIGYIVTADFMQKRHDLFFNTIRLNNLKVLDIGCCVAASGAYVLDHGASYYLGVEYQTDLIEIAEKNLSQFYDKTKWDIIKDSFENFEIDQQFDLVIASGVIYTGIDIVGSLKKLAKWARYVLLDSVHPRLAVLSSKKDYRPYLQQESFVALQTLSMFKEKKFPGIIYRSAYPSYRFCVEIMQNLNFQHHDINYKLEEVLPDQYNYHNRYAILFEKNDEITYNLGYVETVEKSHDLDI